AAHCADRGKSLEKLAVQFAVRHPDIPTTLVGTANPDNMKRNITWLEEPLDEEFLREVRDILTPIRNTTWAIGRPENNDVA
ncbi:aldo/keto reductase, partial [candidate division KSB3 bacterium]|nr:aldo/keto reductase [candidate division KSB3 bacterium]